MFNTTSSSSTNIEIQKCYQKWPKFNGAFQEIIHLK